MVYNNFDEILAAEQVDEAERLRFTRQWLREEYGIGQYDTDWMGLLSDVHNHDDMPKHFGKIRIGSSFSALTTFLARLPEGWHLATAKDAQTEGMPIHPKHEGSYIHPLNQKVRLQLVQVLKNGKVISNPNVPSALPLAAAATRGMELNGNEIFAKKDKQAADEDASELNDTAVTTSTQLKTKSVSIDLGNFGLL